MFDHTRTAVCTVPVTEEPHRFLIMHVGGKRGDYGKSEIVVPFGGKDDARVLYRG